MTTAPSFKILVTGSTFITPRHVSLLSSNGIEIHRLENPTAPEDELIEEVQDKDGYILGGLERITGPVVQAGDRLKAICFTGAGWTEFIPAHADATKRGIAITAAPGANSQATAELTASLIHDRVRNVSFLSGAGFDKRVRGRNFRHLTLGLIGVGNVGSKVARIFSAAYGTRILYHARHRNLDIEYGTGAEYVALDSLLQDSDVISLHMTRSEQTRHLINAQTLRLMKDGAILINAAFADAIDPNSLFQEVSTGRISAALDVVFSHISDQKLPDFRSVSPQFLLQMGSQSGFNTQETVELASDLATNSMINILHNGNDPAVVNPEFVSFRKTGTNSSLDEEGTP